jgi:protein TonB
MPTIVPVDAFTQQITPPPPPGLTPNKNAVTIPVVKPGANFGKGMKDLFNAADLDQPLQARVKTSPTYPSDLKRQGISGECVVEFIVDSNGNVAQAQVIRSTQREFEAPSIQAVLKWKFRPGKKGGRVVNTRCQQLLQFNVGDQ